MEREITLSSFSVKGKSRNRPGDFTTRFTPTLDLPNDTGQYYLAFNRIISMAFTWTNINSGYGNQKIAFLRIMEEASLILISLKEFGIIKILTIIFEKKPKQ